MNFIGAADEALSLVVAIFCRKATPRIGQLVPNECAASADLIIQVAHTVESPLQPHIPVVTLPLDLGKMQSGHQSFHSSQLTRLERRSPGKSFMHHEIRGNRKTRTSKVTAKKLEPINHEFLSATIDIISGTDYINSEPHYIISVSGESGRPAPHSSLLPSCSCL